MFGGFGCPISPSTVGQAIGFYACKMIDFLQFFQRSLRRTLAPSIMPLFSPLCSRFPIGFFPAMCYK